VQEDAVPVEHGRRMAKLIPDAGLVLFEGAGHFAYLDDPDRFCRVVRHFLGAP
jgi:pimeloyl-ACP methyl ester carboxylesterase